jgi:predicted nucleic acid-binding protein
VIRFALDTQLLIEAIRSEVAKNELRAFYARAVWVTWMSAVVVQELLAGARKRDPGESEEELVRHFIRRGRAFTPSFSAWKRSGETVAALHARRRIDGESVTKAFANDVLIAASCAEERVTLITRNVRDFSLIAEEIPFDFIEPWP